MTGRSAERRLFTRRVVSERRKSAKVRVSKKKAPPFSSFSVRAIRHPSRGTDEDGCATLRKTFPPSSRPSSEFASSRISDTSGYFYSLIFLAERDSPRRPRREERTISDILHALLRARYSGVDHEREIQREPANELFYAHLPPPPRPLVPNDFPPDGFSPDGRARCFLSRASRPRGG